jgi:hypothetical protein
MNDRAPRRPDPDRVYERYVKPLEQSHKDEYVLVTPAGQTVLAPTLLDAVRAAAKTPDRRNLVFKIGQRAVGTIVSPGSGRAA